jgi:hypothetical protein
MTLRKIAWNLTLTATLTLSAMAAHAADVRTDYDHHADFSHFRTFSIYRVRASDSLVEDRLREDIQRSLTARGYREVPRDGDVSVTAIGYVRNQQEYTTFYDGLGGGRGWRGGGGFGTSTTSAFNVPIGTLAVYMYDNSNRKLVFRGTSVDSLSKSADKNAAKSVRAVGKIFDKLPKNAAS